MFLPISESVCDAKQSTQIDFLSVIEGDPNAPQG